MNKYCPIQKASLTIVWALTVSKTHESTPDVLFLHESTPDVLFLGECGKNLCEWYGHGCPAYPTSVSTEAIKQEG
jgi:hypothetical protein